MKHRFRDHVLPDGLEYARSGEGCNHTDPDRSAPIVRCADSDCREGIGRKCPDCGKVF